METNTHPTPTTLLAWEGLSAPLHDRGRRWYVIGGAVTLLVIIYGLVSGAWSMSLVAAAIAGMYVLRRNAPVVTRRIEIISTGIVLDGDFAPWADYKDFWLVQTPAYSELHLMRTGGFSREIVVQTGSVNPQSIRMTLSEYLQERADQKERLLDMIIRICKL